jgi:hypothetical protein
MYQLTPKTNAFAIPQSSARSRTLRISTRLLVSCRGVFIVFLTFFVFSRAGYALCPEICDGNDNAAVGEDALHDITTGTFNAAIGYSALTHITSGSENTASGAFALASVTSASNNTATGGFALGANTTGYNNTATGVHALYSNQSGFSNTASGSQSLQANTGGWYNTATGDSALYTNKAGNWNTAIGALALFNNNGNYNTACGAEALQNNTTGNNNVASGLSALFTNSTGYDNTANGFIALYYNTSGHDNTAVGFQSLNNNMTGSNNVAVGMNAGFNLTTGNNNIVIGAGVLGAAGDANKIRIGKSTHTATFIGGIYNKNEGGTIKPVYINSNGQLGTQPPASSRRFKEAIKPMNQTSEAILGLKPVTFQYKTDSTGTPQFGLIAEEVAKVNPDLVVRDEGGEIYTVRYDAVNAMLLNEFLKERRKAQEQGRKVASLEAALAKQQKQIAALSATVAKVSDIELSESAPQGVANTQ